jgi:hypothetical protein
MRDARTRLLSLIQFIHCQLALLTKSNNAPFHGAMEAVRPAVQNWSIMEEVVSLLTFEPTEVSPSRKRKMDES